MFCNVAKVLPMLSIAHRIPEHDIKIHSEL